MICHFLGEKYSKRRRFQIQQRIRNHIMEPVATPQWKVGDFAIGFHSEAFVRKYFWGGFCLLSFLGWSGQSARMLYLALWHLEAVGLQGKLVLRRLIWYLINNHMKINFNWVLLSLRTACLNPLQRPPPPPLLLCGHRVQGSTCSWCWWPWRFMLL